MKILCIASEMMTLTGSPMYNYSLALELKRQGHEVDVFSNYSNNETRKNLVKAGVGTITLIDKNKKYDLTLISQKTHKDKLSGVNSDVVFNIVHSEYDAESPITRYPIDKYICIRPQIKEHIIKDHGISKDKIEVIYNGVDFKRFNKAKRKKHKGNYTKVVLPCTIDPLRMNFIEHYTKKASKDYHVYIYGHKYMNDFYTNEFVFINEAKPDIENYIFDADFVAGILLGRVNLEAMAMGIKSIIHDPEAPEKMEVFNPKAREFENRHNIVNVAKDIVKLYKSVNSAKKVIVLHTEDGCTMTKETQVVPVTPPVVDPLTKETFSRFYKNNLWGDNDSRSGTGSNLVETKELIQNLPALLKKYKIKTMLDIPCGDFYWMRNVDLFGIKYTGADIVDEIIAENLKKYPESFLSLDITKSDLPKVDLIFCRDCLVHFPYEMIKAALANIKKSGSKYLMTTTFPQHENSDIKLAEWRPLNLQKAPVNLVGFPIDSINEGCTENDGIYSDKTMMLFEIKNIEI